MEMKISARTFPNNKDAEVSSRWYPAYAFGITICRIRILNTSLAIFLILSNSKERGFTQNSSPMNCSLILEEVIREHKDKRLPLYIAFLDAKSAFDVVSHNSPQGLVAIFLLFVIFHIMYDSIIILI